MVQLSGNVLVVDEEQGLPFSNSDVVGCLMLSIEISDIYSM